MSYKINTSKKFLFLFLSTMSLISTMIITTLIWWFISPRLHEISKYYLAIPFLTTLRVFYFLIILGIIILYITCYTKYSNKYFHKLIRFSITFLFPINVFLGKLINIKKDIIRESFVHVNNSFLNAESQKYYNNEILILLPHCIQNYDCTNRITNDINNCADCNKCVIKELKSISKKYSVKVAIATGGTLARKIIVESKPKCIIAVACQRDLVDGLLDVFPIPVYGVLNNRPFGPCVNTTINPQIISDFLNYFLINNNKLFMEE